MPPARSSDAAPREEPPEEGDVPGLGELLVESQAMLEDHLRASAPGLLVLEPLEDLIQGVLAVALSHGGRFEYRGRPAFRAWLIMLARHHAASRARYWKVRRKEAVGILRHGSSGGGGSSSGAAHAGRRGPGEPRSSLVARGRGPSSLAILREEILILSRAIELLGPRDREIVRLVSQGAQGPALAAALGLALSAAQQARGRALGRLWRVVRMLERGDSGGGVSPGRRRGDA